MERKEDIGKLLKKRLEAVKSTPGPDLWDRVSDSLDRGDRRRRRFIYYWFTGAGLALLFMLLLLNAEGNFFKDSMEINSKENTQISEDAEGTETYVSGSEETKITKDSTIEKEKESSSTKATTETEGDQRSEVKPKNESSVTEAANKDKTGELPSKSEKADTDPKTRISTTEGTTTKTNDAALKVKTSTSVVKQTIDKGREATSIANTRSADGSTAPKTVEEGTRAKTTEATGITTTDSTVDGKAPKRAEAGITPKTVEEDTTLKTTNTTEASGITTTDSTAGDKTLKRAEEGVAPIITENSVGKSGGNTDPLSTDSKGIKAENTAVSKVPISAKDSLLNQRMALRDSLLKGRIALKESIRKQRTLLRDSLLKERLELKDSLLKERLAVKDSLHPSSIDKDSSVVEEITKPEYIWDFSIIGAPSYFGISNSSSAIDGQFEGADKTGSFGISYGATVNLAILERYTLSFGALKTRFSNSTNNIATGTAEERSQILSFTETEFNTFNSFLGNDETVTILQDIEYVEMPFHVRYRLGGMKLGLHVYGGFSTYILVSDEVKARNTAGETLSFGSASRLSPINLSVDGGFGFYYNFSERLGLEINPTYKYHLNTVSAQSFNARTYSMGIFSGLRYKF